MQSRRRSLVFDERPDHRLHRPVRDPLVPRGAIGLRGLKSSELPGALTSGVPACWLVVLGRADQQAGKRRGSTVHQRLDGAVPSFIGGGGSLTKIIFSACIHGTDLFAEEY